MESYAVYTTVKAGLGLSEGYRDSRTETYLFRLGGQEAQTYALRHVGAEDPLRPIEDGEVEKRV